jgi:DNA-binding NarL/FixJ family response regulator
MAEACSRLSQNSLNTMIQDHKQDGNKGGRARVLLADDHPAVLKDLCAVLQPEFDVIATVENGVALLAEVDALSPDVIVTDIAMPGLDGIAAASEILRKNPAARIVFVTVHDEAELVKKTLAMGVLGYVLKLRAGEDLVPAIHAALRGEQHISPLAGLH